MKIPCGPLLVLLVLALGNGGVSFGDETPTAPADKQPVSTSPQSEPTYGEICAQLDKLQADIELVRLELGKEPVDRIYVRVTNASPREADALCRLLFRKIGRLYNEQSHVLMNVPVSRKDRVTTADVLKSIKLTQDLTERLVEELGITERNEVKAAQANLDIDDVVAKLLILNRQINKLFSHGYTPRDVFAEVTLAISYTARIRELYPDSALFIETPELERRKRPADVFNRLIKCHGKVSAIAKQRGLPLLELESNVSSTDWVDPSDVHDVATLLVEDVAYLHSQFPDAKGPRLVFDPGRKFPSLVYQRVGLLEKQIDELSQLMADQSPQEADPYRATPGSQSTTQGVPKSD